MHSLSLSLSFYSKIKSQHHNGDSRNIVHSDIFMAFKLLLRVMNLYSLLTVIACKHIQKRTKSERIETMKNKKKEYIALDASLLIAL